MNIVSSATPDRQHACEKLQRWRNKIVTKTCIECGVMFEGRNGEGQLCSEACKSVRRKRFRPQTFLNCKRCGKQFGPVDKLSKRYCSQECKQDGLRGQPTAKRGRSYPHTIRARLITCLTCGTQFRAVKDTARRKQLYCSHTCYLRNRRVSHFEQRVMKLLASYSLPIEQQARRGQWTFDGAVTGTTILVEADGAFWHRGAKVQERDARKDAWCHENGYTLMRVREMDFYANPTEAVSVILRRWEAETGRDAVLLERLERTEQANGPQIEVHA